MKKLISPILFVLVCGMCNAQTIQFLFCGKTGTVSPTNDPNTGQDQRDKASVILDWLRIGVIGSSKTNPIYILGDAGTNNVSFASKVLADKCDTNTDLAYCTQCQTCARVSSTTNVDLGALSGKMLGNVKCETKNNDLYLSSTNVNNVVCYETNKINISALSGKKAEISIKYEGRSLGFPIYNISLNYRYNNNAYFSTPFFFNKNSNNVGVFEETYVIVATVPVGVENLSKKLKFEVNPNPVTEQIFISMDVFENFNANFTIVDETGREISTSQKELFSGQSLHTLNVQDLPSGLYLLKISDLDGRVSSQKFTKL